MNYNEAIQFIYSQLPMFTRIGAAAYKADLSTTINLCRALGNPEQGFKAIHIAGTNGKGSVSSFTASVLQESGYKTALFTSPHLRDFRERIRINGLMIPEDYVVDFVNTNHALFTKFKPSFFEMSFAMAACYFRDENIDIAVIETGMGGRLDSTNLVNPLVTVITNIGLDHMQFLGETLAAIATEKAGIIKPNIPVIIGERNRETNEVFIQTAKKNASPIYFAEDIYTIYEHSYNAETNLLNATIKDPIAAETFKLVSPLPGIYQLKNLKTTLTLLKHVSPKFHSITHETVCAGISNVLINTGILGRWQVLHSKPMAIADTGHNQHGLKGVLEQIGLIKYQKLHVVLGMVSDKDIGPVLEFFPKNAQYYFCKPSIPRGLEVSELVKIANFHGLYGEAFTSVEEAFNAALLQADEKDFIFVGGSTFVVAEVV